MCKFLFATMVATQFSREVSVKTGTQSVRISPQGQQSPATHTAQQKGAHIMLSRNRDSGPQGPAADGSIGFQPYRFHRAAQSKADSRPSHVPDPNAVQLDAERRS